MQLEMTNLTVEFAFILVGGVWLRRFGTQRPRQRFRKGERYTLAASTESVFLFDGFDQHYVTPGELLTCLGAGRTHFRFRADDGFKGKLPRRYEHLLRTP